jgi:dolichyl-phosphate beta-glucosyltransferase
MPASPRFFAAALNPRRRFAGLKDKGPHGVHLSLVIPAYNEAKRIGPTLDVALAYFARQHYDWEIIVVDDGSQDDTAKVVRSYKEVRLAQLAQNCGKGAATRRGMLEEAKGDIRFFYDADASTPIEEIEKCRPKFDAGADIVIGSRSLPDSQVELHQKWHREQMGRFYNRVLRTLALTKFIDTQCGFKGFTAKAAEICFSRQRLDRFSFDVELLYIAQRHHLRIDEIPVRWINSPTSRVHPIADAPRTFYDLLCIRANAVAGKYA